MSADNAGLGVAPPVALDKVEWRVDGKPTARGNETVCRFVPYIDGRDCARLLDEWVGPQNWWDEYEPDEIEGERVMWCLLTVRCPDGREVTKRDVGKAGNFQRAKGIVSDAFKRAACVKWGVGRNVYDLPTLWAPCRMNKKGDAVPTPQSLPSILSQLKRLGFEADGGRVGSDEQDDEPGDAEPPADEAPAGDGPAVLADGDREALLAQVQDLDDRAKGKVGSWLTDRGLSLKREGITVEQAGELAALIEREQVK